LLPMGSGDRHIGPDQGDGLKARPSWGWNCQINPGASLVESLGGKSMSHRPGCPWTPVTGSASWYGLVSIHRHAPGLPSTSARVTWPMIAELASCLAGGHSSAGAAFGRSSLILKSTTCSTVRLSCRTMASCGAAAAGSATTLGYGHELLPLVRVERFVGRRAE
jgi:hypothetical protein